MHAFLLTKIARPIKLELGTYRSHVTWEVCVTKKRRNFPGNTGWSSQKHLESYLLSKMALFSKPKSLRYQMFPEVFQHLLNQNLVESSNLEPPIFDPSWSMKIFTIFGSHILHFSTVIWERFEKVLNYSYFQRFSSHFTHKTTLEFINTLYGVNVRSLRPMWR